MVTAAQSIANETAAQNGLYAAYEHLALATASRIDRITEKLRGGVAAPNAALEYFLG